jgi:hypothetical protein
MREIVFFVEDHAHQAVLEAIARRLVEESGTRADFKWLNVRRGHGAVVAELKEFLRDLETGRISTPDLIVVATDANCMGLRGRTKELRAVLGDLAVAVVLAVPFPHIERWLLLDGKAFKAVFGRGCKAPDKKCERARYKKLLVDAVLAAGTVPAFGGVEFSEDLVEHMDLGAVRDASLGEFVENMRAALRGWKR